MQLNYWKILVFIKKEKENIENYFINVCFRILIKVYRDTILIR